MIGPGCEPAAESVLEKAYWTDRQSRVQLKKYRAAKRAMLTIQNSRWPLGIITRFDFGEKRKKHCMEKRQTGLHLEVP